MENRQICGLTLRSSITLGLLAWLTILILIVCGLFLFSGEASASSHIPPTTFDLNNCRVGEKVETAESAQYQDIYYSNFYVCIYGFDLGTFPVAKYLCIPFVPGTNDFSIYSSLSGLEPWSQSTTGGTWSRYPVLIQRYAVELEFSSTDIRTIDCQEFSSYESFVVSCDFILDGNRPSDQKPFTTTNLNSCTLEATQPDPSEFDGPQGDSEYSFHGCRVTHSHGYGSQFDDSSYYKCQHTLPGYRPHAPRQITICVSFTSGNRWASNIQNGVYKYSISLISSQPDCGGLASLGLVEPRVNPVTLETFIVCRLNLFSFASGNTVHPVNISWLNQFCILTADWDAPQPPPSQGGNAPLPPGGDFDEAIRCDQDDCGFLETVNNFLGWLAFLVIPIVIIVVIIGGIQLSLAGDNPEGTKKAKARITQAIVALICYVLLWSVLRWLI